MLPHSRYDDAIEPIIEQEGGYTNHPNDRGGPTKWGITLNFYQNNVNPNATKEVIKNLDKGTAKELYKDNFWQPEGFVVDELSLGDLPVPIGEVILSYSINMGQKTGHTLLQKGINNLGYNISEDGWLGPNTIEKAENCDPMDLLKAISIKAATRYNEIILSNRSQKVFLEGWMRRIIDNFENGMKLLIKHKLDW